MSRADAPTAAPTVPTVYATHLRYRVGALLCLVLVGLFGWELSRTALRGAVEVGTLLFLGLAVVLLLGNVWPAFSRVEVEADHVTLHRPLLAARRVAYRQLADVYEEGRGGKAILLTYHPRRADGMYELDDLATLALPAVAEHAGLYARLAAQVPPSARRAGY